MTTNNNLLRFVDAQKGVYERALQEIRNAKKTGHWMWFVFPQISGLGFSEMANFYTIKNEKEATAYLNHPILGTRLVEISNELLNLRSKDAGAIFGTIDSMKLKSSMTLFSLLKDANPVFMNVINQFFGGRRDERTIELFNLNIDN